MVVDICGEAELAAQQDRAARGVVEQDRRAVAAVIGFSLLNLPVPATATVVIGGAAQDVPSVRSDLDVADDHVGIAVEIAADLVKPGPPATVWLIRAEPGFAGDHASTPSQPGTSATR
jgi:hypothetical protein